MGRSSDVSPYAQEGLRFPQNRAGGTLVLPLEPVRAVFPRLGVAAFASFREPGMEESGKLEQGAGATKGGGS